ncbi:hypothetical protein DJ021_11450 [Phenylobacterium hankyongense]|uniref:Glycerophosphoryl diester phosphodiesterase membrane domain-containing protein n=1 Tax=Phenylobacterium hankyongense TaxID=1813876 RepID=A0A328B5Q5_9CAUL|nr:glycerophosphoryl diester phosphodiesterase membrane domain-containing protein [Phenylobacterium hankyongense]RAK60378.1 hypothetical protein DJ021_11450 [Phenylobacterium hankyongense]
MTITDTGAGGAAGKLDIGRVIQELFAVLRRNFATFAILALILTGLPTALVGFLQLDMVRSGARGLSGFGAGGIVSGLAALILQAALIYATVADLNGRPASVTDSLRTGLRVFLPLLGISILYVLAVAFGLVLLVVPGVMIAVAWCVAVPAFVIEQTGVFDAFGRSAQLTRGNRWRIFGLFVIYVIATIIVEAIVGAIGGAAGIVTGGGSVGVFQAVVIMPLISAASALIGATGAAVLYVELRRLKDGVGPEGLAAIFD